MLYDTVRDKGAKDQIRLRETWKIIRSAKPKTVLDIGCNDGTFSATFASHGISTIGVDINKKRLDQAHDRYCSRDYYKNLTFVHHAAETLSELFNLPTFPSSILITLS